MSRKAKLLVHFVAALGLIQLVCLASDWQTTNLPRFLACFGLAFLCGFLKSKSLFLKIAFPVSVPFLLLSIAEMSLSETVAVGCAAALGACLWNRQWRSKHPQILLDVSILITVFTTANFAYRYLLPPSLDSTTLRIFMATIAFFMANTFPGAVTIWLAGEKRLGKAWRESRSWSFPYYLVGAGMGGVLDLAKNTLDWELALLTLPGLFVAYRYYLAQKSRIEGEEEHAAEIAALHLRTMECLALAVEAKESPWMRGHLQRVQAYAVELGKQMRLVGSDLKALETAALLHDIGKLVVPEYILAKPGKLNSEEFAKMKLHPLVGADIVERIQFPYPVAPLVRAHHERWDGSGYPHGLKADEIPLGARILAVADTLDALTSNREYRRAVPLEEAVQRIVADAGLGFDPQVVEALHHRYRYLEAIVKAKQEECPHPSLLTQVEKGRAPATGLEFCDGSSLISGADASKEPEKTVSGAGVKQLLLETAQAFGNSTDPKEALNRTGELLKRLMPHDALALYVRHANVLTARHVAGCNRACLSSLKIPVGEGMVGWVAQNAVPLVNGNPAVEPGYKTNGYNALNAALAVPIPAPRRVSGVLVVYRHEKDSFTGNDVRILLSVASQIGFLLQETSERQTAQPKNDIDQLTQLPNSHRLLESLNVEVERAHSLERCVGVLRCRLEGLEKLNGRFGWRQRDELVQMVARSLREVCRTEDHVARTGDLEFIVVLPGTNRDFLTRHAGRFSETISEVGRRLCGEGVVVVKIGESSYPDDGDSPKYLLSIAEHRMHRIDGRLQPSLGALETALDNKAMKDDCVV